MFKNWFALAIGLIFSVLSITAYAGGGMEDIMRMIESPAGISSKHPPLINKIQKKDDGILRLTSNKNKILRLEKDAASVVVNNPEHISVLLDSPRLLIIIPHAPGATSFTVLNAQGKTILEKEVIVSNVKNEYVRIRRICGNNNGSCEPTTYYYCPDGCHEVTPVSAPQNGSNASIPAPPRAPSSPVILNNDR